MRVWCDRAFYEQTKALIGNVSADIRVETIVAGKYRRYQSMKWWQQLLRVRTIVWPNFVDGIKIAIGTLQSITKLIIWRPDVVFCKGGFVSLPVGAAAHLLHIPIVIHDSDAHPGLTNSILARWARTIATGTPLENYNYPVAKSRYIGVPIDERYHLYTISERGAIKRKLGFNAHLPLVVITGGGLGSESINRAVVANLDALLDVSQVLLISGEKNFDATNKSTKKYQENGQFQLHGFVGEAMADTMAAADVVVARAGATTLLELAALHTPTILIPNPYLTGGHQVKNAKSYEQRKAAIVINESELSAHPGVLSKEVVSLIDDSARQKQLADAIATFAHPNAANDLAQMIRTAGSHAN